MTPDLREFRSAESALWRSVGVSPIERFVRVRGGGALRVLELGDGPPIVFIHGVHVAAAPWCLLAAALRGFRCILLDRPGVRFRPRGPILLTS